MMRAEYMRKLAPVVVLAAFLVLIAAPAAVDGQTRSYSASEGSMENGQAEIFYLYHAGWAVKTASALMIFDYWESMERPEEAGLEKGFIDPEEIKDLDVYVFTSHGHGDHFDERILEWRRAIPKITYVWGWGGEHVKAAEGDVAFGDGRVTEIVGPMTIKNIHHDFDGIPESAFLIEVDGLTIYFSGDHGNAPGRLHPVYKYNIDYMAKQAKDFDVIFLSVFGSPTYDGELYAIEKFKPSVMIPMHYGSREKGAEGYVKVAQAKFPDVKFWYPLHQGDKFSYKK